MTGRGQVRSDIFIGRTEELHAFTEFLQPDSGTQILNIHTAGEGGIGKTQLLLRMRELCASDASIPAAAGELIDFYHTEDRSRLGVMQHVAANLGREHFPQFQAQVLKYQETRDMRERERLLSAAEGAFQADYALHAAARAEAGTMLLFFFDTYECIQRTESRSKTEGGRDSPKEAGGTGFSRWIETWLFPAMLTNTRLVVSGRYPLQEFDSRKYRVRTINLAHFSLADTMTFWQQCFGLKSERELAERIGSQALVEAFHALADGRPVLLALFVDWVNYARNPLSPQKLLQEIERRTSEFTFPVKCVHLADEQRQVFEKALIERVASLMEPENHAVTYMAIANRRMTPPMFQALTGIPLEKCKAILLHNLKPLSFIKYKRHDAAGNFSGDVDSSAGDIILLHDEMRRLMLQHWWDTQDLDHSIRQEIAQKLVDYYDRELLIDDVSDSEREIYTSEVLDYAFLADAVGGLRRFCYEFDIALDDGKYDYCDLILRDVEKYSREHQHAFLPSNKLEIELRRIKYNIATSKSYADAIRRATEILEMYQHNEAWKNSSVQGHFWFAKGHAEQYSGLFDAALTSLREAKVIFYDCGEDTWLNRSRNLIGYSLYRQGKFAEAEEWIQESLAGFLELINQEDRELRGLSQVFQHRQAMQGIQYNFGNLAMIALYTGRFHQAVCYAIILQDIVQSLARNDREIARVHITVGHTLAMAGQAVEGRYFLEEAVGLAEQIGDRLLMGRAKTNLAVLHYRSRELAYVLEYYRAEDIERIVSELRRSDIAKPLADDIGTARRLLEEAVSGLEAPAAIDKELSDAYFALGELWMVAPWDEHWEQAEATLQKSVDHARASAFAYLDIDACESLITLYYFWNGSSPDVPAAVKELNKAAMQRLQKNIDRYDRDAYPNLFGKYEITLGDIDFDRALDILRSGNTSAIEPAVNIMRRAFGHYITAALFMKRFSRNRYYLALRIFYNRLSTLIDIGYLPSSSDTFREAFFEKIGQLQSLWATHEISEFHTIYGYACLRIRPETQKTEIDKLQHKLLPEAIEQGRFGMASLLNDGLIGAYSSVCAQAASGDECRERLILQLNTQVGLYRTLGDEYQATRCIWEIREEHLPAIVDPRLRSALEGFTDTNEGMLQYRRGEYGRLLEYYLHDELRVGRDRFDRQFPRSRTGALHLLQRGEKKILDAVRAWEAALDDAADAAVEKSRRDCLKRHHKNLGETRFRLGELFMLNQQFEQALEYLRMAIQDAQESDDTYRYDNAVQSYLNALYFAGKYDDAGAIDERRRFERELEATRSNPKRMHASILGRLRVTQGDALFSRCFQAVHDERTGHSQYIPREGKIDIRQIRTMLRYYVEACEYMARHNEANFAAVVRVLLRRIQLLADREAVHIILRGLPSVWKDQPNLTKGKELDTLLQLTNMRSIILDHEIN